MMDESFCRRYQWNHECEKESESDVCVLPFRVCLYIHAIASNCSVVTTSDIIRPVDAHICGTSTSKTTGWVPPWY